ncbi:MAG: DUF2207 domain-containing protein [Vicinamibacterales bacterium]
MPIGARVARVVLAALLVLPAIVSADEGWVIERMHVRIEIQPDASFTAAEAIDVDFKGLEKHGIYRDIPVKFAWDDEHLRVYDVELIGLTTADGRRPGIERLTEGSTLRYRIGDPDRTINGKETYRLVYRVRGGLNPFADHDELYWNAIGPWPVTVTDASVTVRTPGDAITRVTCYQGPPGSKELCDVRMTRAEATFRATRPLREGEQLTIVTALAKGAVTAPEPHLVARPRNITQFFDHTPGILWTMWGGFALVVSGLGTLWWRWGRDRRYVSFHHPVTGAPEERVPLFGARPVAVELEPPDGIRPGQMGLLVDERADTLDVTATIVDLAVRGYLSITELPKHGWFGKVDWQLDRKKEDESGLLPYERMIFDGLFGARSSVKLSDLRNQFYKTLEVAKKALYKDAVERGWFPRNPETVRIVARIVGILTFGLGIAAMMLAGANWGLGLLGLPVIAGGLLLAMISGLMPRRTAAGRAMLQRTLGFARYIRTAEKEQQAFAERANLFTEYLPYAVAFRCVEKWARAFRDIDLQRATAGWYVGTTQFNAASFSSGLGSFSSSMSSAIASTPGGSGGSGFSGGSSGGGGGGGGGGSW